MDRYVRTNYAVDYKIICKSLNYVEEIKLKDFQYKLNNKILVTKSFLKKINITANDICSYCNNYSETVIHLFFECETVVQFVNEIKNWLLHECGIDLNTNHNKFIFSIGNKDFAVNYISLLLKYFIYKSKFKENSHLCLQLNYFKNYLKQKLSCRKYILRCQNKPNFFDKYFQNVFIKL